MNLNQILKKVNIDRIVLPRKYEYGFLMVYTNSLMSILLFW